MSLRWAAVGGVGVSTVTIAAAVDTTDTIGLRYAPDPEDTVTVMAAVDPLVADGTDTVAQDGNPTGVNKFSITGLDSGTRYVYTTVIAGVLSTERYHFTTPARGPHSFSFAFSGTQAQGSDHVVFDQIRQREPRFFLHLGNLWANPVSTATQMAVAVAYRSQFEAGTGRFARLVANTPTAYLWDATDWGGVGTGQSYFAADAEQAAYRAMVPSYPLPDPTDGIYHSFGIGRCLFIMLDVRSFRTSASLLGDAQTQWLLHQLSNTSYRVKFVCLPPLWRASYVDGWGPYSAEFNALNAALTATEHVLVLSSGIRALGVDSANSGGQTNLVAGALDADGTVQAGAWSNGYRANATGGGQFGWIDVVDDGGDEISVAYTGYDDAGTVRLGPWDVAFPLTAPHVPAVNVRDNAVWNKAVPKVWLNDIEDWFVPTVRVYDGTTDAWRTL